MTETPKQYSDFLTKYGGLTPLNEPAFILHWGSDPIRRKGLSDQWLMPSAFLAGYLGCWVLAEWAPPEEFGPYQDWADYPFDVSRGAYLPLQVFKEDGNPVPLDSQYLNLNVLALFLKVALHHKYDTLLRRYTTLKNEAEEAEIAKTKLLVDRIEDGAPAFLTAASGYGKNASCNTYLQQKMDLMERMMPRLHDVSKRWPRGMSTVPSGMTAKLII